MSTLKKRFLLFHNVLRQRAMFAFSVGGTFSEVVSIIHSWVFENAAAKRISFVFTHYSFGYYGGYYSSISALPAAAVIKQLPIRTFLARACACPVLVVSRGACPFAAGILYCLSGSRRRILVQVWQICILCIIFSFHSHNFIPFEKGARWKCKKKFTNKSVERLRYGTSEWQWPLVCLLKG